MTKEELRGQMRAMRAELTGDKREAAEQQAVDHMIYCLLLCCLSLIPC